MPPSMLVIGAGATGVQVCLDFQSHSAHEIRLFEAGPRILPVRTKMYPQQLHKPFRASNIAVNENFGSIVSFEKAAAGVRMIFSKNGARDSAEATLAVVAVGWAAETRALSLATAGVEARSSGIRES